MASYIQGLTDYIPQLQPYQPDYNFLGNVLQARQSRYDTAHKQLNKMYGTLLYSPMLREDNIQQRDQFFKTIDQDIKKMSGMDLSLQQNVDAAGSVFTSLYDNKGIVKDMTFTKQLGNELERAENYKTCLDQEKCGGGYWDVGVTALQYRAEEFKNASANDAMKMSAPEYTPFINVTEKAMNYVKDLMGNKGFGVTSVNWSPDGKYIVTTKNGQNLTVPLQQLFQNQFGMDQKIQSMYDTMAYVQRKNYVKNNAEKFGGDEVAAEDEYINAIVERVNQTKIEAVEAQQAMLGAQAKKNAIANKIKKEGSTGNDGIAKAYQIADVDYTHHLETANYKDATAKIASGITTSGNNRLIKASMVDSLISRALMGNDFKEAAINISNLTGETKVEADPYAKSYYDHSLRMTEKAQEFEYKLKELEFKTRLDILKDQATSEVQQRGPATSALNSGKFIADLAGTTASTDKTDEALESYSYVEQQKSFSAETAKKYTEQYTNHLLNITTSAGYDENDRISAKQELKSIYGANYDEKSNQFMLNDTPTTYTALSESNPINFYNAAISSRNKQTSEALYGDFFNETLDPISKQYNDSKQLMDVTSKVYKQNNLNVKSWALTNGIVDDDEKNQFQLLFKADGDLRSKAEYTKLFVGVGKDQDDAEDIYDDMYKIYNGAYNGGYSTVDPKDPNGKIPIVKALYDPNAAFGMFAEGKTSGGVQYAFDATAPAAFGTQGLLTFGDNAMSSKNVLFSAGIAAESKDAIAGEDAEKYRSALNSVVYDLRSGGFSSKDSDRPLGKVTYMDIALGDPNFKAVHIDFSPSYMDKYKGSEDTPGWGRNEGIRTNGVTIYIPKSDADNDFTKAFALKPYDIILEHEPVTLNKKNGGSVTISKMKDGRYNVGGALESYDINGRKVPVNPGRIYNEDVGGNNIVMGLQTWLDQISIANTNYLNHQPVQRMYDPNLLPSINQSILQQTGNAGETTPLQRFDQLMAQGY